MLAASSPSPKTHATSPNRHSTQTSHTRRTSLQPSAGSTYYASRPVTVRQNLSHDSRTSTSSSSASSAVSPTHIVASTPAPRSPKRPTADCGTQYTPPDWPPTHTRASGTHALPVAPAEPIQPQPAPGSHSSSQPPAATSNLANPELRPEPPPEPRARVTPQPLQSVGATVRRSCSSVGGDAGASRSQRARSNNGPVMVMPKDYADCDPKELSVVISDMLMELILHNDEIPLEDGQLTRFHSRAPPGISVKDYLHRITFHATLPPPILLSMVFLVDRLCSSFSAFRVNSLTVHRFLITAATVASKGLSDSFWTNSTYSRVGGVSIKELALLELELLSRVEWRIIPSPESLVTYYKNLVARSPGHVIEGEENDDENADDEDEDALDET